MALIVEAIAIDDGAVLDESKGAGTRIAGLRARRQRADFDEAEPETEHRVGDFGIFVEAGRKADRIGKVETEGVDRETRIIRRRRPTGQQFQRGDRRMVRRFSVEQTQKRRCDREGVRHLRRPEKSCRPSAPRGSGSTRATVSSESGA